MQRFLIAAAALVVGLLLGNPVLAGKSHGSSHHGPAHHAGSQHGHAAYHTTHGVKFQHGYYYKGRNHNHWTRHVWNAHYGCYTYYDPGCLCWYYWCQPDDCYYPVSYCPYGRYSWGTGGPVVGQP